MIAAAHQSKRLLATGFNYRFDPSILKARELLDSGIIGELDHVRSYTGYSATEHTHTWLHEADTMGGGALRDNGIHRIDLTRYFLGEVASVQGECHRVIRSGGHLFLSTPNRYSLGPDPHMGVPAGGYWPKRWQAAYARRQGAIPPKRNLLSKRSLVRLTSAAGFSQARLLLPQISEAQRRQASRPVKHLADLYQALQKLPLSHRLLFLIGPALLAVARKPEAPKHQP